jgi:uncharacterized OB-fold protein
MSAKHESPPASLPVADPQPETRAFWDAAAQGRFILPHCEACGRAHWYPRAFCPHCFSDRLAWQQAQGIGTIYSFSIMRRAAVPYAIAYVTLAEGPTMMTNLVDCDFAALRIGGGVRLVFKRGDDGRMLPMFTSA